MTLLCSPCVTHANRGQKRMLDPTELELQAVVACLIWVLEAKPEFSVRTVRALSSEPPLQPLM